MEEFARKCIRDHRNPIVKVNLPAKKLFFGPKNDEEKKLIDEQQQQLKKIFEYQRIEKRSGRAQAIWLPNENIAQVTKVVKNLVKFFGFQNKNGLFLNPEEMLFLMETNRLEVRLNDHPLSIESAFDIVLKLPKISLTKYRIYKKMAILGYKMIRFEQLDNKKVKKLEQSNLKRTLNETLESQPSKKPKEDLATNNSSSSGSEDETNVENQVILPIEVDYVQEIFEKMRKIMPSENTDSMNMLEPDYYVFTPNNIGKNEPDFSLFICETNLLDMKNFNTKPPAIYATCTDDVSFYRLGDVHLPFI